MKVCLIINPNSGKKKGLKIFELIKPVLDKNKINYELIKTKRSGHAISISNKLKIEDYDGLIMIGGDGTFHEIVSGLMSRKDQKKIPIGVIPGGSGNSFLYNLYKDPKVALKEIIKFKKRYVDVIQVKTKNNLFYSINLIGWGLITDVGKNSEKYRWLGTSRYTLVSLIEIIKNKTRKANLKIGNKEYNSAFTFIIACNTKYVGKGMYMAPKADVSDGLLDLIVVKGNLSRTLLFKTLPKLFKGTHITDPNVTYHQVSNFSLTTQEEDLLNIDGELKGETPIDVKIIPNAIEVFN